MRSSVVSWAPSVIVDWTHADVARLTIDGDTALAFDGAVDTQRVLLELTQGGAGGHDVTWPANVRFSSTIPTIPLSTEAGKLDRVGFVYNAAQAAYDVIAIAIGY